MGIPQQVGDLAWPTIRMRSPGLGLAHVSGSSRAYAATLLLIATLGIGVRLLFVLGSDFPLNDGGLFYQMARDVQASHYALPASTTYNGAHLPFAYPPFGIYAAALVNDITGMSMVEVFRYLPLVVSSLTIGAFFLLARDVLRSRLASAAAVLVFALVPRGFEWMIMGGGVTRAFGLLFALLTIHSAHRLYVRQEQRFALTAMVFGSLALLSHLEMGWFAAFSCGLLFARYGRNRAALRSSLLVVGGVAGMLAPWLGALFAMHGVTPLTAALRTGSQSPVSSFLFLIELRFTDELLFPLALVLGLLGAFNATTKGRYLLPSWLIAIVFLDPRGMNNDLAIPLAMLAGMGVKDVVYPMLVGGTETTTKRGTTPSSGRRVLAATALATGALYLLVGAVVSTPTQLSGLSRDERGAMAWSAAHTPPSSAFVIVTGDQWPIDNVSEWFPVLAGRKSIATVQGYEWAPGGAFAKRVSAYDALQECARADQRCVERWIASLGGAADYVYVSKIAQRDLRTTLGSACCTTLQASLRASGGYVAVYDGPAAVIYRRG
ncbi:MAG TPA: glycosyltransferase family 39 protein [Dehalococcoidia bacterium]|nr:glycosyltransferase family 39 protein [Dehalococcoidia bacterium]